MDEKYFDFEAYISKRLKEIDDLEERRFAKNLLLEGFTGLFSLFEDKYNRLEQRIREDMAPDWNDYVIQSTVVSKDEYDPIHESLFPICMEDLSTKAGTTIQTIFLSADDQTCALFEKQKTLTGCRKDGQGTITCSITKAARYWDALTNIYQLYRYNEIPWSAVHTGYLERFYDIRPLEEGEPELEDGGQVEIDFGEFAEYVHEDMLPVWNIKKSRLKSREFVIPCIDSGYYEHAFITSGEVEGKYLIGANTDIENIRYEKSRVILKSKQESLKNIEFYQICPVGLPAAGSGESSVRVLSNRKKDSFAARYLHHTGNFLQTRAELMRKIHELTWEYGICPVDFQIVDCIPEPVLHADMNVFIREEIFPMEKRNILVFYFKPSGDEDYLYEAHIRYLLSQLQLEFIEYKCVGVLS